MPIRKSLVPCGWPNGRGLGLTATDVGNLRLALMALLPNLAGLALCFGVALRRR